MNAGGAVVGTACCHGRFVEGIDFKQLKYNVPTGKVRKYAWLLTF
jgi:hypothetical protein